MLGVARYAAPKRGAKLPNVVCQRDPGATASGRESKMPCTTYSGFSDRVETGGVLISHRTP